MLRRTPRSQDRVHPATSASQVPTPAGFPLPSPVLCLQVQARISPFSQIYDPTRWLISTNLFLPSDYCTIITPHLGISKSVLPAALS